MKKISIRFSESRWEAFLSLRKSKEIEYVVIEFPFAGKVDPWVIDKILADLGAEINE